MKKIEVKILNPESIDQAEKLMVCAARLTQRGHQISCLDDFMDLYEKPYQRSTVANLVKLPHPTIQKYFWSVLQIGIYYSKITGSIIIIIPNRANRIPPIFVVFK